MCFICRLIHHNHNHNNNKEKQKRHYVPMIRHSPNILRKNRQKYLQIFTDMKISDSDYSYGGLVDMLELWYGKEVDKMIQKEQKEATK